MSADLAEGESRLLYPPPGLPPGGSGTASAGPADEDLRVVAARHPGEKGADAAEAVTAALDHAIEDGSYQQVLDRWGLQSEAVESSETNPPGLPKTEE